MEEIFKLARKLGQSIEESGANAEYSSALAKIRTDPRLVAGIREFKRIQTDYNSRGELGLDQEKHLSKLYFDLCMNPDAKRFLECEKRLLALMLDVQESLWSNCDISLEFLS